MKDLWQIGAAVKETLGYELTLHENIEETRTVDTPTPACGRLKLRIYQLNRLFVFTLTDSRWWRRKKHSRHTTVEKLDRWWDSPEQIDPSPECKCNVRSAPDRSSLLGIVLGRIGIHVAYEQSGDTVAIPSLGLKLQASRIEDVFGAPIVIERSKLPPHITALVTGLPELIRGVIVPYRRTMWINRPSRSVAPTQVLAVAIGSAAGALAMLWARHRTASQDTVSEPEEPIQQAYSSKDRESIAAGPSYGDSNRTRERSQAE